MFRARETSNDSFIAILVVDPRVDARQQVDNDARNQITSGAVAYPTGRFMQPPVGDRAEEKRRLRL